MLQETESEHRLACLAEQASVIQFPEGLIGCPEWRQFVLQPGPPGSPFMRLQCLGEPSVCFVVVDLEQVQPDYRAALPREELLPLELGCPEEGLVLCTLAVRGEPPVVTANLLGPLVINPRLKLGRQLVLADSGYSARHPIAVPPREEGDRSAREDR